MLPGSGSRLIVVALFTGALVGCNAVLGIDEAEPRDVAAARTSLAIPTPLCDGPGTTCSACIHDRCSQSLASCLADHACRLAVDAYRACLGEHCNESTCVDSLRASAAQVLANCVSVECGECAGASPLVSICDLYCSCMEQQLPATAGATAAGAATCEEWNGQPRLAWTIGDRAACKAQCSELGELTSATCRWSHCELATSGETASHCQHAISADNCPLKQSSTGACKDKKLGGFGCKSHDECCSGNCPSSHICAD